MKQPEHIIFKDLRNSNKIQVNTGATADQQNLFANLLGSVPIQTDQNTIQRELERLSSNSSPIGPLSNAYSQLSGSPPDLQNAINMTNQAIIENEIQKLDILNKLSRSSSPIMGDPAIQVVSGGNNNIIQTQQNDV